MRIVNCLKIVRGSRRGRCRGGVVRVRGGRGCCGVMIRVMGREGCFWEGFVGC